MKYNVLNDHMLYSILTKLDYTIIIWNIVKIVLLWLDTRIIILPNFYPHISTDIWHQLFIDRISQNVVLLYVN